MSTRAYAINALLHHLSSWPLFTSDNNTKKHQTGYKHIQ